MLTVEIKREIKTSMEAPPVIPTIRKQMQKDPTLVKTLEVQTLHLIQINVHTVLGEVLLQSCFCDWMRLRNSAFHPVWFLSISFLEEEVVIDRPGGGSACVLFPLHSGGALCVLGSTHFLLCSQ